MILNKGRILANYTFIIRNIRKYEIKLIEYLW